MHIRKKKWMSAGEFITSYDFGKRTEIGQKPAFENIDICCNILRFSEFVLTIIKSFPYVYVCVSFIIEFPKTFTTLKFILSEEPI